MKVGNVLFFTVAAGVLVAGGLACGRPVVISASAPAPAPGPGGMEGWERTHPEASQALGAWVREHPEAAHRFFDWDGHHTERAHAFVTWSITHPNEGIRAFAVTHRGRGWEEFDFIMRDHQPAANAFIGWCRHYPEAAESLMRHPGGLEWAGHHIYAGYWH